jgi:hypothetical protein
MVGLDAKHAAHAGEDHLRGLRQGNVGGVKLRVGAAAPSRCADYAV